MQAIIIISFSGNLMEDAYTEACLGALGNCFSDMRKLRFLLTISKVREPRTAIGKCTRLKVEKCIAVETVNWYIPSRKILPYLSTATIDDRSSRWLASYPKSYVFRYQPLL